MCPLAQAIYRSYYSSICQSVNQQTSPINRQCPITLTMHLTMPSDKERIKSLHQSKSIFFYQSFQLNQERGSWKPIVRSPINRIPLHYTPLILLQHVHPDTAPPVNLQHLQNFLQLLSSPKWIPISFQCYRTSLLQHIPISHFTRWLKHYVNLGFTTFIFKTLHPIPWIGGYASNHDQNPFTLMSKFWQSFHHASCTNV